MTRPRPRLPPGLTCPGSLRRGSNTRLRSPRNISSSPNGSTTVPTPVTAADRASDDPRGDRTAYATLGTFVRLSPHVTANAMASAGFLGARGDDVRVTLGGTWSPQPESEVRVGRGDRDRDGVPDLADACIDDAEDDDD